MTYDNGEASQTPAMRKRGRRSSNGVQPAWMLARIIHVVDEFAQSRSLGTKHTSAITDAVEAIRKQQPRVKISETEVKRILAKFHSPRSGNALLVTRKSQAEVNREFAELPPSIQEFLGNKPPINVKPFGFGPAPNYARSNKRSQ